MVIVGISMNMQFPLKMAVICSLKIWKLPYIFSFNKLGLQKDNFSTLSINIYSDTGTYKLNLVVIITLFLNHVILLHMFMQLKYVGI